MILYEYVNRRGRGVFTEWRRSLQTAQQAQLDQKLDQLGQVDDPEILPDILAGTREEKHIFKLKLGGKVRLRPMVCRGPLDQKREITLLYPAYERDWHYDPPNAPARAEQRRQEILADPSRRRLYEPPS